MGLYTSIQMTDGQITYDEVATIPTAPAGSSILHCDSSGNPLWITDTPETFTLNDLSTLNGEVSSAQIGDNSVTFAKLQDINTDTVLGRATAGSGDVEEISCTAAGRALLDDATAADQRATLSLDNVTNDAQLKRSANDFNTFTEKASPVGADILLIEDSADSGNKKYVQISNLPTGGTAQELYDATVAPTGADYTTVSAAVTAGERRIQVIADTTESVSTSIPTGEVVNLWIQPNVTLTMGNNSIAESGAGSQINIQGGGSITYARVSNDPFLNFGSSGAIARVKNIDITNLSGIGNTSICEGNSIFEDCTFTLPNFSQTGIYAGNVVVLRNIKIIGGGASCDSVIECNDESIIDGVTFEGQFDASNSIMNVSNGTILRNLIFNHSTSVPLLQTGANIDGLSNISSIAIKFEISSTSNVAWNNIQASNSDIEMLGSTNACTVSNSHFDQLTSASTTSNVTFENVKFSSTSVDHNVQGNHHSLRGCEFLDDVDLSNGDFISISNCRAGAVAGGGTVSITIAATCDNTMISNTKVDAAISDSGTNTNISQLVTY